MNVKKSKIKKTIFIVNSHFNTSYSVIHQFAFVLLSHLIEWYICSFKILMINIKLPEALKPPWEKIGPTWICPTSFLFFLSCIL